MYSGTSYVGVDQVKNGRLYVRYGSSYDKTIANRAKTLTDKKTFAILLSKMPKSFATPLKSLEKES